MCLFDPVIKMAKVAIKNKFKMWFTRKFNPNITQREANILCEGPTIDPPIMISTYMNIMLTCLFFSPLIPHTIPFAFVASLWTFWVWKYNFLRINKRPEMFSSTLATYFSEKLPWIAFGWALAFFYFAEQIVSKISGIDGKILPAEDTSDDLVNKSGYVKNVDY